MKRIFKIFIAFGYIWIYVLPNTPCQRTNPIRRRFYPLSKQYLAKVFRRTLLSFCLTKIKPVSKDTKVTKIFLAENIRPQIVLPNQHLITSEGTIQLYFYVSIFFEPTRQSVKNHSPILKTINNQTTTKEETKPTTKSLSQLFWNSVYIKHSSIKVSLSNQKFPGLTGILAMN